LSAAADAIPQAPDVAAEQVGLAQELAAAALDETRSAIAGLRPPVLDDLGLAASLESLGHSLPGLDVKVQAADCLMSEHVQTAVYRTAQEALQNVAKHADAQSVRIRLYQQKDRVVLEVSDDGSGFGVAGASTWPAFDGGPGGTGGPTGFGLPGMAERAELLGGTLELISAPGRGTTVRLVIPLRPAPDPGESPDPQDQLPGSPAPH
jgi:two-component system NarL family sensor kinase